MMNNTNRDGMMEGHDGIEHPETGQPEAGH